MRKEHNIPVYLKLIHYLKTGFRILDQTVQQQIIDFTESQQHKNGGFTDRAGTSDLYYSLFGFWLSLASDNTKQIAKFKSYINHQKENQSLGAVEQMALVLIQSELLKPIQHPSLISLLKIIFRKGKKIQLSYQFFLLTLIVDAQNKQNSLYYFFARIWLFFYKPKGNLPCSIQAAFTFAKKKVGLKYQNEQKKLISYYQEGHGFRAFENMTSGDILSTAVALFVLRETNYDLRLIAVDCLNFVQQNYNSGAFLSGDGDKTHDLEYTFYGLLALGTLIEDGEDFE